MISIDGGSRIGANIIRHAVKITFLVTLILVHRAESRATVVQIDAAGFATGITGLSVGSVTYDIDFLEGSYNSIFPSGDTFADAPGIVAEVSLALHAVGAPRILFDTSSGDFFFIPSLLDPPAFVDLALGSRLPQTGCSASGSVPVFLSQRPDNPFAVPTLSPVTPSGRAAVIYGRNGFIGVARQMQEGSGLNVTQKLPNVI